MIDTQEFNTRITKMRMHSMGMYSTWVYDHTTRSLFDAGEGLCLALRNKSFAIDKVFLSHGHYDHIGGLAGLIYTRSSAMGDKEKPLTIFYPKGWDSIESFIKYTSDAVGHIKYDLNFIPITPGIVSKANNFTVEAFKVDHAYGRTCLGYRMVERRSKLKPEFSDMNQQEIYNLLRKRGFEWVRANVETDIFNAMEKSEIEKMAMKKAKQIVSLTDPYDKIKLAYCGDSIPVPTKEIENSEILFHEATFLDPEDRNKDTHSTTEEAIQVAIDSNAESLVLLHISGRYIEGDFRSSCIDIVARTKNIAHRLGWDRPTAMMIGNRRMTVI